MRSGWLLRRHPRRGGGDVVEVARGDLHGALVGEGVDVFVGDVGQGRRVGGVEGDGAVDGLDEGGAAGDGVGDERQDLLGEAALAGESGDECDGGVDADAELDGGFVDGGDVGAGLVVGCGGVEVAGVGEVPPGVNPVGVLGDLRCG
jgi:hypothetical protein